MRIEITSIQPATERCYIFEAKLGDETVIGHVTEFEDGELHGFNFDERFFDVLFAFDGLGGQFNRDYWAYRENEAPPFPWDYGNHDEEIMERAIKVSGTPLASLR